MTQMQIEMLKQPFTASEVQWRLTLTNQSEGRMSGLAVPYLDSRAIQKRLDAVVGPDNWQNLFQTVRTGNDDEPTAHICTISIYNPDRNEWVSKSNGAGNTDIEPIKGGMSDALKRAASMWNIGRYLYEFEAVWVNVEMRGKSKIIAKSERAKLDGVYNKTVEQLFPRVSTAPKSPPPAPQVKATSQQQQQPPPMQTQQNAPPPIPVQNLAIYTVLNATLNKDHTIIDLWDGAKALKAYFKGIAQVAKNQRITNAVLIEKGAEGSRYYILESFNIAANTGQSAA
ncbi:MAG: Rad52/Rad22 family DNA repair protein [Oscillospiraceae bacterium]|nr:Rad52/Rad22 family DNA repair protein [Oscillospiraceae bacterium]